MSYRNLEIYKLARELAVEIHKMSLTLPKFELYEQGSQIRRSSKSIRSNIVEGYGRRKYTADYSRFLTFAHSSCDETIDHLESLLETKSLKDEDLFKSLLDRYNHLGAMLNRFNQRVSKG